MSQDETASDETHRDSDAHTPDTVLDPTDLAEPSEDESHDPPASYTSDLRMLPMVPADTYQLIKEFAKGGIGRITRARDRRLDRVVAIKELRRNTRYAVSRFSREVRITAKLQHPNIIPVHEAGRWPTGEPFFAMKLVEGGSLEDSLEACQKLEDRIQLVKNVADVADAIAYAHSQNIVHRDLKPSNVLVGPFGETVVIDWGLAKDLGQDDDPELHASQPRDPYQTTDGVVLGTPPYMPPEQALGHAVDQRADVYALGAILYHVLSGRSPYFEYHPRDIVTRVASRPPTPLSKLQPDLPPDLLAIVEKAMHRRVEDRYPSAGEMAEELQRFITGGLVAAYSYSLPELLRRFVKRNRAAVATGVLGALVLAALGTWSVVNITKERNRAVEEEKNATRAADEAKSAQRQAEARLDEARLESARETVNRDPTRALALLKQLSQPIEGAATVAADAVERGVAERVFTGHADQLEALVFSPDSQRLITSGRDKSVRVWPLSGAAPRMLSGHGGRVPALAMSNDGEVVASGSYDGTVRLWDREGNGTTVEAQIGPIKAVAISPDGRQLVAVGDRGVRLWPRGQPGKRYEVAGDRPLHASFSPDGERVLTGSHGATLRLWSLDGDFVVLAGHEGAVPAAHFSPDGSRIVSAGEDGTLRVWSRDGEEKSVLKGHDGVVEALAFLPDGKHVVSGGIDGTTRVWPLDGGDHDIIARHVERISSLAVSRDGRFVASASWDKTVSFYDRVTGSTQSLRGHSDVVTNVAFSPDGRYLASVGWDHEARLWRVAANQRRTLSGHRVGVKTVAFSPDGKRLASGGHDDTVRIWDVSSGERLRVLRGHRDHVFRVLFSPNGKLVASSSDDLNVMLWPLSGDEKPRVLEGHSADVEELAFSPDGSLLASAGEDAAVGLWRVAEGDGRLLRGHEGAVTAVGFLPDGQTIVSSGRDGAVRLWNSDGSSKHTIVAHRGEANHMAIAPGGGLIASVGSDDALRLWNIDGTPRTEAGALAGAERLAFSPDGRFIAVASGGDRLWLCAMTDGQPSCRGLSGHTTQVNAFVFSDDSTTLVTGSGDATIRLYSVDTGESRTLRGHTAPIFDVALSPTSALVASASADTTIRLWPVTPPPGPATLRAWLDEATTFVSE